MGDDIGPACFASLDCSGVGYDGCTYGFGLKPCGSVGDCFNCGSSFEVQYNVERQCSVGFCQVRFNGSNWYPCGMCFDEPPPLQEQEPDSCEVTANNFSNAFYIKNPNGVTQFAITDGGHLLTHHLSSFVHYDQGDFINTQFEGYPNNNLPIYNGDTLVAFFHSDNNGNDDALYLRGSISEFEGSLNPQGAGNFIIKNSADMVVAYIDGSGNLHLMGCVDDNGYNF